MERIIRISIVIALSVLYTQAYSQIGVFESKKSETQHPTQFYDDKNMQLYFANDTLRLYISNDKKMEISAIDISTSSVLNGWPTFISDTEHFFQLVNQLEIDIDANNYHITFNPASGKLIVEQVLISEYKSIGDELLPTYRHKVRFDYPAHLTQVAFYLGEMDELSVLKEARIHDLVHNQNKSNEWRKNYQKRNFNKSIQIADDGESTIKTYSNLESHDFLSLDYDIGLGITAGYANFASDSRINFHLRGKKTSLKDNRIFLLLHMPVFYQENEQGSFDVLPQIFPGLGFSTLVSGRRSSIAIGHNVMGNSNILNNYDTIIRFDYAFHPQFNVFWNSYFDWSSDSNINALGVSFRLFSASYMR